MWVISAARVFCLVLLASSCLTSRILVVFPVPDKSLKVLGDSIVSTLLNAGHEVTFVTAFPKNSAITNLTYIDISSNIGQDANYGLDLHKLPLAPLSIPQSLKLGMETSLQTLKHEAVQKLMMEPEVDFDLVLVHWFYSTLLAPLGALFECPLVWYVSGNACWASLRLVHELPSPAYSVTPHHHELSLFPFTTSERASQMWQQLYFTFWSRYYSDYVEPPIYEAAYSAVLRSRGLEPPPYELVAGNGSLLLINSHPPLGQRLALPLNTKLVGGHHLQPLSPLPQKLQTFLDNAKHGLIFMDLGAGVDRANIPRHVRDRLLDMFGQLEQQVVWRLDVRPPHTPRNVHVLGRQHRLGILCHPKMLMYIMDGSTTSLMEALHCRLPAVIVPTLGDQFLNANLAAAYGYAIKVEFTHHFAWTLREAIGEILSNDSYRNSAMEASTIFKLRSYSAADELLHLVEMTSSTGARHLRSPARLLSPMERYHLDLWILLALVVWFLSKVLKVIRVHLRDFDWDKKDE